MDMSFDFSQIKKGDKIAVALSGGKDSVFLLYNLKQYQKNLGIVVCAINVEHGIRGENSKNDSIFCKELAKSWDIPLKTYVVDSVAFSQENGYTLEQGARILRYNCFFDAINCGFCDKVATAHHKNDLSETVLFNMFRGSGLRGAKINSSAYQGKIIRPILNISRQEIDDFVSLNNLSFVTDETNDDTTYSRNYIRSQIIPVITQKFEHAIDGIYRFSKTATEDDEYLFDLAKNSVTITNDGVFIPSNTPRPLFSRAIIIALNHLGIKKDYTFKHIDAVINLAQNQSGAKTDLLLGAYAIKQGNDIKINLSSPPATKNSSPFLVGKIRFDGLIVTVNQSNFDEYSSYRATNSKKTLFFDGDKIPKDAVIRYANFGDTFTKFGGGTKSLKRYLTDKKIYAEDRKNILVLANDTNILLILGIEISDQVKITSNTKNILKINFEKI